MKDATAVKIVVKNNRIIISHHGARNNGIRFPPRHRRGTKIIKIHRRYSFLINPHNNIIL